MARLCGTKRPESGTFESIGRNGAAGVQLDAAQLAMLLAERTGYQTLRPGPWAAAHREAIRNYRQQERRERSARRDRERRQRHLALPPA